MQLLLGIGLLVAIGTGLTINGVFGLALAGVSLFILFVFGAEMFA